MESLEFFVEDVTFGGPPAPATWWSGYRTILEMEGFGEASINAIDADSSLIVDRGVLGADDVDGDSWPEGRVRTGVVVGAVQSGKTASMMAVAARALDEGVDVLVVLGGTRTSLWLQTFDRFGAQLDIREPKHSHRLLRPKLSVPAPDEIPSVSSLYAMQKPAVKKALAKGQPVVAIAMKQVDHLERLGAVLRDVVFPAAVDAGRNIHLVVIDDEADDASIADPHAPAASLQAKQVPLRIVELWGDRNSPWETVGEHVRATYVAYTATPQANFLQDSPNPLAPRDFAVALRTPGRSGGLTPRTATFHEPAGLRSWYCGGEMFYETFVDEPLCVVTDAEEEDVDPDDSLHDSVRAYLVATAVRLARSPDRLGPASAQVLEFSDRDEARSRPMKPASMLVHPSAAKGDQFHVAAKIHAWSVGGGPPVGDSVNGRLALGTAGIRADMENNRDRWSHWLESYRSSASELEQAISPGAGHEVPSALMLDAILSTILDEIVPGTAISVVNSDVAADERPRFAPVRTAAGWRAAPNLSTIFVAGNVMSRGLTLEGLTTTYFSRASILPSADTQMQMQRWFGFRGEFLELCRVFLRGEQLELFATYHEHDEALRRDLIARMDDPGANLEVTVLQGKSHVATAKVSQIKKGVLSPGTRPFIRLLNEPSDDESNQLLVQRLFDIDPGDLILDARGALLRWTFSAMETAEILDLLTYSVHKPAQHGPAAALWQSMENHIGPSEDRPFYRARGRAEEEGLPLGIFSPAYLAAYLRFWSASAGRQVPGLMTTDPQHPRWNLSPAGAQAATPPQFSFLLRMGSGDPVKTGPLADLPFEVSAMNRSVVGNFVDNDWGSRGRKNGVALGDEVLDLAMRALPAPDGYRERTRNDDGLILIHPIAREGGGISLAFGIALPPGGPDHVRAEK